MKEDDIRGSISSRFLELAKTVWDDIDRDAGAAERVIGAASERPEIAVLALGVRLSIRDDLSTPFFARGAETIELRRAALASPPVAALHLRHALELALWDRILEGSSDAAERMAAGLLASHTTALYYAGMTVGERALIDEALPSWMKDLMSATIRAREGGASDSVVVETIGQWWADLIELQGIDRVACPGIGREVLGPAYAIATKVLPLAGPTETILALGGDNRIVIDHRTGLGPHGSSPIPRPHALSFASCTTSTTSDAGYEEAECLRQSLLRCGLRGELVDGVLAETERQRRELHALLDLDGVPGAEIIFTSSGTDGELYALHVALRGHEQRVVNILIAPNEVGSGTLLAARGLHFDTRTSSGAVMSGAPVEGLEGFRSRTEILPLRDESGAMVPIDEIDRRLTAVVAQSVAAGEKVLVHLVDVSKTGLLAPTFGTIRRLQQEHGSAVRLLVDGSQMRMGTRALARYLQHECMVVLTGSKFFTGPPFSGALVIPPGLARELDDAAPLPVGFSSYSTLHHFPLRWRRLASLLGEVPNLGLLLRWRAALWEMTAFDAVPQEERAASLRAFGESILAAIRDNTDLQLVSAPPPDRGPWDGAEPWDRLPTIFTFLVRKRRDGRFLLRDEARQAHRWLNQDLAGSLPAGATERERRAAAVYCHIGQPVDIERTAEGWASALRLAAGARIVSAVAFDERLGPTPTDRIEAEICDAKLILEKVSLIVRYWEELSAGR